jgi:hypothetical protein
MTVSPCTTYARATASYDDGFRRRLIEEIITAIAKASLVTDVNVMARTGEMIEALTSCLIATASLTPHFGRPSHLREFAEELAKRVRREVAKAQAEGFCNDFVFGARRGGNA